MAHGDTTGRCVPLNAWRVFRGRALPSPPVTPWKMNPAAHGACSGSGLPCHVESLRRRKISMTGYTSAQAKRYISQNTRICGLVPKTRKTTSKNEQVDPPLSGCAFTSCCNAFNFLFQRFALPVPTLCTSCSNACIIFSELKSGQNSKVALYDR